MQTRTGDAHLTHIIRTMESALAALLRPGAWRHDAECRAAKEGPEACDCGYMDRIYAGRAALAEAAWLEEHL